MLITQELIVTAKDKDSSHVSFLWCNTPISLLLISIVARSRQLSEIMIKGTGLKMIEFINNIELAIAWAFAGRRLGAADDRSAASAARLRGLAQLLDAIPGKGGA